MSNMSKSVTCWPQLNEAVCAMLLGYDTGGLNGAFVIINQFLYASAYTCLQVKFVKIM